MLLCKKFKSAFPDIATVKIEDLANSKILLVENWPLTDPLL